MAEPQAAPSVDDKINALTDLVTKLAKQVGGMVSRETLRRADDASPRDDAAERDDEDSRDDEAKAKADEEKAKKDAARDALFGKRKDKAKAKSDNETKADEDDDDDDDDDDKKSDESKKDWDEDEDEKKKEAKGDESEDEDEDKEKKADERGEPEPMASDDDRRKDRKDRKDWESDKVESHPPAKWRGDSERSDARSDAMYSKLQRRINELERNQRRPRVMTDDELNALSERQQEWDRVAQMHGLRASRPLDGEKIASYDRRIAKMFQKHSPKWKDTDLANMPIEVVERVIAPEIRADSIAAAYRSDPIAEGGMLREVRRPDRTGRIISEFVGPVNAANGALEPFRMPSMAVRRINTQPNQY